MNDNYKNQFEVKPVFQEAPPPPNTNSSSNNTAKSIKGWISNKKVIATILGLVIVFGGIGAGLLLVQQTTEYRRPAATPQGATLCGSTCQTNQDCQGGGYQCNPLTKTCALTVCLANAITCSTDDCTVTPQCGEYCGNFGNFSASCTSGYTCKIDPNVTPPPQFPNADLSQVGTCVLSACANPSTLCSSDQCSLATSSPTATAAATAVATAVPTNAATATANATTSPTTTTSPSSSATTKPTSTPKVVTTTQTTAPIPVTGDLTPTIILFIIGTGLIITSLFVIKYN